MLSLIQLNIQQDKHFERILPFLKIHLPDVLCLQELPEHFIPLVSGVMGGEHLFAPTTRRNGIIDGVGIFSRQPLLSKSITRYAGNGELKEYRHGTAEDKRGSQDYHLVSVVVQKDDLDFRIITTHFPWTADGEANDIQRNDLDAMLTALTNLEDFVLCGDFNAPRGKEIFTKIAERYTDHIPNEYTWSLDQELHRAPINERQKMVDGIFSTPEYEVSNVERICGLSDHCAFTAQISKRS